MGIHPTLLPVSPMALVRPALFQFYLTSLPVFLLCSFPTPFPFPSFPVFPSFNSLYICAPGHHPLYHSMSLPYNLPQEFPMYYP